MMTREWSYGDKVVHAGKPEWGIGQVTGASGTMHEGKPCQRVVVRFERAGVKTLSTAFAELRPASEMPSLAAVEDADEQSGAAPGSSGGTNGRAGHAGGGGAGGAGAGGGGGGGGEDGVHGAGFEGAKGGWLEKAEAPSAIEVMSKLPSSATDPFTPFSARLKATIDLYRFTDSGGSLLDWAAAQSGLRDPLSRFSRHELEQLFRRFSFVRDEHLKRLVLDMKKQDAGTMQQMLRAAPPAVQQALKRLDVGR
jgi:hypothetical protein